MSKTEDADQNSAELMKNTNIGDRNPTELNSHPKHKEIYGEETLEDDFLESIEEHGVKQPIKITDEDTIIDGHRRVRAAIEAEIDSIPVLIERYDSAIEEREDLIHHNKQRTKTFSQRMREALELEAIESERAKQRQGARRDIKQTFAPSEFGSTREKVAQALDLSGETYRQAKRVWEKKEAGIKKFEREIALIDQGEQTIYGAFTNLQRWEELRKLGDAVEWDTALSALPKHAINLTTETFEDAQPDLNKKDDWTVSLRTLQENHQDAWNNVSHGDLYIFTYLLEKNGLTDFSTGETAQPDSLTSKKPSTSALQDLYWEDDLSLEEIGILFGAHADLVEFWLSEEEIPKRMDDFNSIEQSSIHH